MKYIHIIICILALMFSASCAQQGPKDGDYTIHLLTTNDVQAALPGELRYSLP